MIARSSPSMHRKHKITASLINMKPRPSSSFYTVIVTPICLSLALQVVVGALLICVVIFHFMVLSTFRWNLNDVRKHRRLNILENVTTVMVFLIVVVNILITATGVHRANHSD
uniref:Ninjurin 2 n=1 Tax=Mola mola TaxID=94237 RepID=A0A3Q3WVP8_MOLML